MHLLKRKLIFVILSVFQFDISGIEVKCSQFSNKDIKFSTLVTSHLDISGKDFKFEHSAKILKAFIIFFVSHWDISLIFSKEIHFSNRQDIPVHLEISNWERPDTDTKDEHP